LRFSDAQGAPRRLYRLGKPVRLGDYFGGRPILLTLNYYDCQNLCPLELQNLVDTMDQLPFGLGKEYAAVTVSFDPTNTAADATQMKNEVLHRYSRPDAPNPSAGWHFLTALPISVHVTLPSEGVP
jgi:protein SCO1/2